MGIIDKNAIEVNEFIFIVFNPNPQNRILEAENMSSP